MERTLSPNIVPRLTLRQWYASQQSFTPAYWRDAVGIHGIRAPELPFDSINYQAEMFSYELALDIAWRFHFADAMIAHEASE